MGKMERAETKKDIHEKIRKSVIKKE